MGLDSEKLTYGYWLISRLAPWLMELDTLLTNEASMCIRLASVLCG